MTREELAKYVQEHFTDGLVLIVGSGLSAAEGIPGMLALADRLSARSVELSGQDSVLWEKVQADLAGRSGLEAALLKNPPTESLEKWIRRVTCDYLIPSERDVMSAVIRGERSLRLTALLEKLLKPQVGLPIVTTNYDRLVELACELAGFHVDVTATGQYAGPFDHVRSAMASCHGIITRGKTVALSHFPRAVLLKPHGSFDWYQLKDEPRRCALDLDAERLLITPGINKYRAGYNAPFDKHRDLANDHIKAASRLLVVGYGFNDDHLQTHLVRKIRDGTPTLILSRSANALINKLAEESPRCVCVTKPPGNAGYLVVTRGKQAEYAGADLWDVRVLAEELLT